MKRVVFIVGSFALVRAASVAAATPWLASTIHKRHDLTDATQAVLGLGAPGAEGMVRRGGHTEAAAIAYANLASHAPMGSQDKVRIGSVTKTVVATVAMQLVAAHMIGLDDTVENPVAGIEQRAWSSPNRSVKM